MLGLMHVCYFAYLYISMHALLMYLFGMKILSSVRARGMPTRLAGVGPGQQSKWIHGISTTSRLHIESSAYACLRTTVHDSLFAWIYICFYVHICQWSVAHLRLEHDYDIYNIRILPYTPSPRDATCIQGGCWVLGSVCTLSISWRS